MKDQKKDQLFDIFNMNLIHMLYSGNIFGGVYKIQYQLMPVTQTKPKAYHLLKMGALAPPNYYKNWVSFCFGCGICRSV